MEAGITHVQKRDGRIQPFDKAKITAAIEKAFAAVGKPDRGVAEQLADKVVASLERDFKGRVPRVEDIQDVVERVLMEHGYPDVAKDYILYRQQRSEIRALKQFIGVTDDLKLSVNAANVLKRRYLLKNENGEVIETPSQMFRRVANAVAEADKLYDPEADIDRTAEEFYEAMASLLFLPNSPTLMNAGTELGQLSACFVLPIEDSMEGIFETLKHMALIHQSGGGTGFSFSRLRPKGDIVRTTSGIASGPVSFMTIYDAATDVVKQGGRRRGANMAILRVDHPDIVEFITAKSDPKVLRNFNISVGVTDQFMEAVRAGRDYELVNPRNGAVVKKLPARDVFELIVAQAWKTGDPGLAFLDTINRANPTPKLGQIESTNPCGEVPLLPYESCNLGSINVGKLVKDSTIDYDSLRKLVWMGVHFLDNVIDVTKFPLPQVESITKGNRKIGLGIMGFADLLIELNVPYDSEEAVGIADRLMAFVLDEARKASADLAAKRGTFPNYALSIYPELGLRMRNATVTSVAPTGTISIVASCSSGIEPLFAVAYVREVLEGTRLLEVNPVFERMAKGRGIYSRELMLEIAKKGSIRDVDLVPEDMRRLFVTSMDIAPEWHVRMQAAFQKHCDNAVAKTVNLPREATPDDVRKIYLMAYELGCKGITVYRYGSKPEQVLYVGPVLEKELGRGEHVAAHAEYDGSCPTGICSF
ncbi:MAG: vitamin B12-dependent ribonucleotide reductase [Armatimonadota bacterium]|nr:vitamin B12-dependent ribonucleotide reductase [Armatimonadota bacterium]